MVTNTKEDYTVDKKITKEQEEIMRKLALDKLGSMFSREETAEVLYAAIARQKRTERTERDFALMTKFFEKRATSFRQPGTMILR